MLTISDRDELTPSKQQALDAALAQIDAHFGAGEDTPERRKRRAQHRLEMLEPLLASAHAAAMADQCRGVGECPEISVDPFAAYVIARFLRHEANTDEAIVNDAVVDALESVADEIENGAIFGCGEELLSHLNDEIEYLRYVAEHGEDPVPAYLKTPAASQDAHDPSDDCPF